jgi:hypothetical protein
MEGERIVCFVPAQALEHPDNSEFANLLEKIKWALIRYKQNDDFFSRISINGNTPSVYIERKVFHKEALGYEVQAIVKC